MTTAIYQPSLFWTITDYTRGITEMVTRKRKNISYETDETLNDLGMNIAQVVEAYKESVNPVLTGGSGPRSSQLPNPLGGPRPNPSTPVQTVSTDTVPVAPSAQEYRDHCAQYGHLEASIPMTNTVVCARCTTPMQDKAGNEQEYTVMWNEPTPLTDNRR